MDFNEECITLSQMNLINNSRFIWRRISTWSREYLISRLLGIGNDEELFTRLYNESTKYGDMLRLVFGGQFSDDFTWHFNEYTIALRDLISAQKEGDLDGIHLNLKRLQETGVEMSDLLGDANPFWDKDVWQEIFQIYLQYMIDIANSFSSGDHSKDVEIYDALTAFTNSVGDYFAQGIFNYLDFNPLCIEHQECKAAPQDYEGKGSILLQCLTIEQVEVICCLRMFWFELSTWTRQYLIHRYFNVGDLDMILARLNRTVEEYGIMLSHIFGEEEIKIYLDLMYQQIELLISIFDAQIEGDVDAVNEFTRLIYENVNRSSAALAAINPFWDETELRSMLYQYLHSIFEESLAFLTGDFDKNINIFANMLTMSENRGNYLAKGIFDYISAKGREERNLINE